MKVSTKLNASAEKTDTNLTINWAGMTPEDVQALAQQALIVKLQGQWRRDGAIPAEATVNATDHKVGSRAPKKSLEETVASLSADDRTALIARLLAMQ